MLLAGLGLLGFARRKKINERKIKIKGNKMKLVQQVLATALIGGAFSMFSTTAAALPSPCLDGNTMTCIVEKDIFIQGSPAVEYEIENQTQERLFGFGVTNTAYGESDFIFSKYAETYNLGWNGRFISQIEWDSGKVKPFAFFSDQGPTTTIWRTGEARVIEQPRQGDGPQEFYLGSFASLFGTEDDSVAFFWNANVSDSPLNSGVELDNFFLRDSTPRSDFSTFGAQGNVVTTSVAAVPEPETYAMFLVGLGLLGFVSRKKHQA